MIEGWTWNRRVFSHLFTEQTLFSAGSSWKGAEGQPRRGQDQQFPGSPVGAAAAPPAAGSPLAKPHSTGFSFVLPGPFQS